MPRGINVAGWEDIFIRGNRERREAEARQALQRADLERQREVVERNLREEMDREQERRNQRMRELMDQAIGGAGFNDRVIIGDPNIRIEVPVEDLPNPINNEEMIKSGKVVARDGETYPIEDCILHRGAYYPKKDKKLVFKDDITGEYQHISNAWYYVKSFDFDMKTKRGVKKDGISHYENKDRTRTFVSRKYDFSGEILSIDHITGWKCKEVPQTSHIVDFDEPEESLDDIRHYEAFKNKFSKCTDKKVLTKIGNVSPSYLLTEGLKYTFGVELEVSRGFIPAYMSYDFNISCVRDGSLNGGEGGAEYVTGILTGDTGFNHLQEICGELSKRSKVDNSCGIHVHLGIPGKTGFSKQLLINSYRLYCFLENEVFAMLPKSRRKNDYCKPLKKMKFRQALNKESIELDEDYNDLMAYMTNNKIKSCDGNHNKRTNHPQGSKCGYDKSTPRYCWVNYVPAMFDTRGNQSYSIEIRNHSGSTNFTKIKNWVLIQMAILAFADQYPQLIEPGITLETVLEKILPKRSKLLVNYINDRKEQFGQENFAEKSEYEEKPSKKLTIKELCV